MGDAGCRPVPGGRESGLPPSPSLAAHRLVRRLAPHAFHEAAASRGRSDLHVIRRRWQAGVLALSLALAWADYAVGPFVLVPITYAVPVGLAAWHLGRGWGVSLAVALTAARFLSVLAWGDAGLPPPVGLANAGLRLGVLTGLAVLLARVEGLQRRLRGRVATLEGLLPVCMFCKSIRKSDGGWEPFEVYVAARSEARFSHGFCDPCGRRQYPEMYDG